MANWKRLIALALSGALCLVLLAGCAGEDEAFTLSVCVGGTPESLDPIYAQMAGDQTILNHLYENLMRVAVDVSGEATVTNGMAKSVEQEENQDGTVTYRLRLAAPGKPRHPVPLRRPPLQCGGLRGGQKLRRDEPAAGDCEK